MTAQIMVVDDDPGVRISVEAIFRRAKMEICAVDSGSACLEKLQAGFRGVILMDIMMPQMDGWDTIRAVEEQGYADRVILLMLTAKEEPDQKMLGLQQLVVDYITKPFDPKELINTVQGLFEYLP